MVNPPFPNGMNPTSPICWAPEPDGKVTIATPVKGPERVGLIWRPLPGA